MNRFKRAVKVGARIEREHKPTVSKLERKYKKNMPNRKIYESIARDHIKELGMGYYPALQRMEKRLEKKQKMRRITRPRRKVGLGVRRTRIRRVRRRMC